MRILYPTSLADASPPDVDAAAVAACGDGALAITAADLTALGWATPGGALAAGLTDALDLSVSVDGVDGGVVAAPAPPPPLDAASSSPAKRAKVETPPPPVKAQPSSADLVWVPLGAAWWPAEVVGAGEGEGGSEPSLAVTILALNTPLCVPAAVVKGIEDAFESRAALAEAGTAAGAQVRGFEGGWRVDS